MISFLLLGHCRVGFLAALGTCQIDEANLGGGARIRIVVERVHDYREDEVGAGGVFVHGRARCLTLLHAIVVDLLGLVEGGDGALLYVVDLNHACVGVFPKFELRFVRLLGLLLV